MDDSVAVKDPLTVVEEDKQETAPEAGNQIKDKENAKEGKSQTVKKKAKKIVENNFDFGIPKMKGIPILNKDTVNPNTFDLNYLLNPEVQKLAQSGHRLTQSSTSRIGKMPTSPKNHIQKNIANSKLYNNSKSNKDISADNPESALKKQGFDVEERFYKKAKQTEEKIKAWKEQKTQEEIAGCTFKPQIKAKREKKSYNEFYEYMKAYTDKKESKIKTIKEEENKASEKTSEYTHQPKLCEKSLQMIARKSDIEESTFDRLHKLYKNTSGKSANTSGRESLVPDIKSEESSLFHPTVNKKSSMMNRSEPVEKILYDDALRRISKDKNPPIPKTSKFISNKSEKVLIDKLKRDFEEAFICITAEISDELNYTKLIELFKLMFFIKDEHKKEDERLLLLDSWKTLSIDGENCCRKPSILVFTIAVMGFYEDWMAIPEGNQLVLTSYEANKIHIKFDLFYTNRVSVVNKSTVNKSYKTNYEYSFHPQTVLESESLAKNWRSQNRTGGRIEDMLIAEKVKTQKKIEEKRQINEEQALDECTFQPIIEQMPEEWRVYGVYEKEDLTAEYFKMMNDPKFQNVHKGVLLHDLAKVAKQRKETKMNDKQKNQDEKELENCTFAPKLQERIFPKDYLQPEIKSKPLYEKPERPSLSDKTKKSPRPSEVKSPSKETLASEAKLKAYNDLKNLISEPEKKPKWPFLESNNGEIAIFSIVLPKSTEKLAFNIKNDDPASKVMEFSKIHNLKKEEEYRLVKELTLLKTS
ncbi:hypothetical protein SteCoe_33341 [Stentor coeruleus]|uniref:Uncharacterized protein n=1 Tax=Stentor coeruleus TaxID=5963 RepID=A0A1R2AX70_9CILI|nr:hypothetical protein SteCoe_33341 [Stentor coeruleus]